MQIYDSKFVATRWDFISKSININIYYKLDSMSYKASVHGTMSSQVCFPHLEHKKGSEKLDLMTRLRL